MRVNEIGTRRMRETNIMYRASPSKHPEIKVDEMCPRPLQRVFDKIVSRNAAE